MELWTQGIDVLKMILSATGGAALIFGGVQFFDGQRTDNAAHKATGVNAIIAGGGIVVIAQVLIPVLGNMITV